MFHSKFSQPRNHLISKRRQNEQQRSFYENIARSNQNGRFNAEWEVKTNNKIQRNLVEKEYRKLKQQAKMRLEQRRDKLADLLKMEDRALKKELHDMQETSQQRRDRLEQKALKLKQERIQRNDDFARQMRYQKFLQESDELRDAKTRALTLQYADHRKQQELEKQERLKKEQKDQEIFDSLWEEKRMQDVRRHDIEAAVKKEKDSKLRRHLDQQVLEMDLKKQELEELKKKEALLMKERWEIEEQDEKRKQQARKDATKQNLATVNEYNKKKLAIRQKEIEEERQLDLKLLKQVLDKEAAETQAENQRKRDLRKNARAYQALLLAQMQKEAEDDAHLERMREEDIAKQMAKREAVWARERERRERLMKEVIQDRKRQVALKLEQTKREQEEALAERYKMQEKIEKHLQLETAEARARKARNQDHQEFLLNQMRATKQTQHAVKQMQRAQEKAEIEANLAYKKALERELQLLNQQKPKNLNHIDINPRQRIFK